MTNTVDSVWKKVDRRGPDECWPWLGKSRSDTGYGRLDIQHEEGVYAHRAAYLSTYPDSIPLRNDADREKCVLHTCDNPTCCNPKHLFLGSHNDNMADKKAKGRCPDFRGELGPRSKFTADEVFFVRLQKKQGATINALAMLHEVSRATISGMLYGRHYRDVLP